ncbi:MAG: DNA-binding response regulator [Chloroflexi bacterium]|nr:MAG: DNA-binding response regulator [Chloroflexota bacterium]
MKPARVLLADDHAVVRAGIRNALEEMPAIEIVGEVGDGPSLIESIETLQPDCVLLDVTMPDFEPISAIRRIRARHPSLRILVVSAYDDDVYVQGLLSVGVDGYHLKDQPLSDLRLAFERVLAGERWISSSLLDKLLRPQSLSTGKSNLSTRQRDILRLLVKGMDNRAIATRLDLSVKTIENHLTRLYRQLKVQSRLEAARFVQEHPEVIGQMGEIAAQAPVEVHPPNLEQVSVLLVDDNRRYRHQLRRMVGKAFPQVMIYEASNTEEVLQLVEQVNPQVIFVDVVLGDEDGIQCTRRIKLQNSAPRIILISAYPDREFHRRGLEAGAMAFLDKKDLDAAALHHILEDIFV